MPQQQIKTFEEACALQGLDPVKVLPDVSAMPEKDRAAITAYAKLCIIQRSLNGEWTPDWSNQNQRKYYPWYWVEKKEGGPSGFGLSYFGCACDVTRTGLGSRLFYRDAATAEYAFDTFTELYENMVLIPQ